MHLLQRILQNGGVKINILENLEILTFEIGNDCNLRHEHNKCPINRRVYINKKHALTTEKILGCMHEAASMGFRGYVAFHYYNEPLLYKDKIETIISAAKEYKYFLLTNGLLLDKNIDNNTILKRFDIVIITCYNQKHITYFNKIKKTYSNVKIINANMDERLQIYTSEYDNIFGCKRPLYELPIDYYGNIHICCNDWNNQYYIGNINEASLENILESSYYQNVHDMTKQRLLDLKRAPEVCKHCNYSLILKARLPN